MGSVLCQPSTVFKILVIQDNNGLAFNIPWPATLTEVYGHLHRLFPSINWAVSPALKFVCNANKPRVVSCEAEYKGLVPEIHAIDKDGHVTVQSITLTINEPSAPGRALHHSAVSLKQRNA